MLFILHNKSFVYDGDALDQGYFWTIEMKNNLHSLMQGEGYPLWSWARGPGVDTKLPIDPFLILASLFPIGHIELGYTVAIVLRLYFAGIAFMLFCREAGTGRFGTLIGALCYVTATWTINVALIQGQFIDMMILFPLLAMSVDRIYKGKSPLPFMLIVGIAVAINYYLAYMGALVIILYLLLRYFKYNEFSFRTYFAYVGRFIIYGIVGILISAVFALVTIQAVSGVSVGGSAERVWMYSIQEYYRTGIKLLSLGYKVSYSYIGIPVFALLCLPALKEKLSAGSTHVIMSVILYLLTLSPYSGTVFNGFTYSSNRWYYLLIFFLSWLAAENMDLEKLSKTKNILIMLIWWTVLAGSTLGLSYFDITGNMKLTEAMFVGGNLAAGFVMILIVASGRGLIKSLRAREVLITLSVIGTLVITWNCTLYKHMDYFYEDGEVAAMTEASTQRAGSMIDDDGFYRIDQVDWINIHQKADQPSNENLQWQNNTLYLYDSRLPSKLTYFNKLVGNNLGYTKRVYVQSNGNRMGLDFLWGVKYFLGDDVKNERLGSDAYAGYAFDEYYDLDGVNVYKSRYDSSLGFLYDKFMTETEFGKLSRLEREQALMQALVVPDEEAADLDKTKQVTAEDIETDIKDVPYKILTHENITMEGNTLIVGEDDASILIFTEPAEDCQLVVSFDNLRRVNDAGANIGDFKLKCKKDGKQVEANNKRNNQTISGIVDYDLNLGYYDFCTGRIRIKFSKAGRYEFDKLYVSAMSTDLFDKYAAERCESVYEVTGRGSTLVTGTLDARDDGWLFLSIPVNANWNVYIDDEQAEEIHNANIAFFAAPVTKGTHTVELRYDHHSRNIALIMSGTGLLLMIACAVIGRRRRKKQSLKEEE